MISSRKQLARYTQKIFFISVLLGCFASNAGGAVLTVYYQAELDTSFGAANDAIFGSMASGSFSYETTLALSGDNGLGTVGYYYNPASFTFSSMSTELVAFHSNNLGIQTQNNTAFNDGFLIRSGLGGSSDVYVTDSSSLNIVGVNLFLLDENRAFVNSLALPDSLAAFSPLSQFEYNQLYVTADDATQGRVDARYIVTAISAEPFEQSVPEPYTASLLAIGLVGIRVLRAKRNY